MRIVIEDGVTKRYPTETDNAILGFFPPYRWLSNFHMSETIMPDDLVYPSVENAYQAYKLESVEDRKPFITYTCGQAKKMGQQVKLRSDWENIKVDVMRQCLESKFKNKELMDMLQATAPKYLREDNNWNDIFWGYCNDKGQNKLGILLMEIRDKSLDK